MIGLLLGLGIVFTVRTVFLFLALWIMIKVQKLDWNFLDLVGAAAIGSGLDMIPYVGHYLAVAALWFCIKKITNGDLYPDVVFTVSIGYALVFCMNLFVLSALLGDVRAPAKHADAAPQPKKTEIVDESETEKAPANPPPRPVAVRAAIPEPVRQPGLQPGTNSTLEIVKAFTVRGVIESSDRPVATIQSGVRMYFVIPGETRTMETKGGRISVRCDGVHDHQVLLTVSGEQLALPYD
jgi:hypothetical protein